MVQNTRAHTLGKTKPRLDSGPDRQLSETAGGISGRIAAPEAAIKLSPFCSGSNAPNSPQSSVFLGEGAIG